MRKLWYEAIAARRVPAAAGNDGAPPSIYFQSGKLHGFRLQRLEIFIF
jgi:hypothetical protein